MKEENYSDSDSDSDSNPNQDTTDFDFTQLEQSVLISKDDGLSKLIKGSDQYYYQYFLNILNQKGYQLDSIQQEHFSTYKGMKTKNYKKICLRRLFVEYDNLMNESMETEETTKRKRKILYKINKRLFKINFDDLSQDTSTKQQNAFNTNLQTKELVSQFDNNKLAMDDYLKDAYTEKGISKLSAGLLQQLNLLELIKAPNKVIDIFFNKLNHSSQRVILNDNIPQFFNQLVGKKDFKFTNSCFNILTIEQMEELGKLNKKFLEYTIFVGNLYFKKFGKNKKQDENSEYLLVQKEEILSNLNKAYIWTKSLLERFNSLKQIVLRELLQYGIEIQHYDFDLFLDFLKNPIEIYQNITKSHRDVQSKIRNDFSINWQEWHGFNICRCNYQRLYVDMNTNQLIEKYLQKYFEQNSDFSIFEQYLESHYLKKQKAISRLYKGEEAQDLNNYFTNNEIKLMNNTKVLYLCDNNKPYFIHGEPVNLYVELKNIQSLTIKIFQINMKNFYMAKTEQLSTNICLDGFIPTEEINFTYDCPPIKKVIKEFAFESIQKTERGTFIIEFIGNGLSCRAIIEKGRLCLKQTIVTAGYKYEIFDEKFEKLLDDKIGLWIEETFYSLVKGEIVVPFPKEETKYSAIIQYGDFYQKENLLLQPESFRLICSFILGDEQIQLGSDVSVIIIPKLTLNGTNIGFEILKDANVQISCQNEKGVPQTFNFRDINFESQVPLELKFPVNQKLLSIQVDVTGKIKQLHKKDDLELQQTCNIKMEQDIKQQIFIKQLLRFDDADGYSIFVLGKNGEPYKNVQVQVLFTHSLINEQIKENLITDENGQIKLGFLPQIEKIHSTVISTKYQIQKQEWKLLKLFSAYQSSYELVVNLGEKLTLPFRTKLENVLLYQIKNLQSEITPINNIRNQIQFEENEITIEFTQKGVFLLRLLEEAYSFQFKVIDNTLKQCKDYLYTQNERIQKEHLREINLKSTVTQLNDTKLLVQGDILYDKEYHIIALATTFYPDLSSLEKEMQSFMQQYEQPLDLKIEFKNNIYLCNLKQSDELGYIIERKNQPKYLGNTLEKPQILLNRFLTDCTETQEENLKQVQQNLLKPTNSRQMASKAYRKSGPMQYHQQSFNSFCDFLKFSGRVITNIHKDKNHYSFEVPVHYSTIVMLVYTDNNYVIKVLPLQNKEIQIKDLCHESLLEKNKFYSTFRSTKEIIPQTPFQIQDISSTEIFIIDSLNLLFKIQKELVRINKQKIQEKDLKMLSELLKWDKETSQFQQKFYNQYQCDELNLFLFMKDARFFETVILNHIKNKIEKSFIDSFLLQDHLALSKYEQVQLFQQLNALEQALLVIYNQEIAEKKEEAQIMAKYLQQNFKTIVNKQDDDKYKLLFDTILGVEKELINQKNKSQEIEKQNSKEIKNHDQQIELVGRKKKKRVSRRCEDVEDDEDDEDDEMSNSRSMSKSRSMSRSKSRSISRSISRSRSSRSSSSSSSSSSSIPQFKKKRQMVQARGGARTRQTARKSTAGCASKGFGARNYNSMRESLVQTFQQVEATKEYCEKHYSVGINQQQYRKLVRSSEFFIDLANHSIQKGYFTENFISSSFMYCTSNFTEIISVLALISLPFESPKHTQQQSGNKGIELLYPSSALILIKEIQEAQVQPNSRIIINQSFFDPQNEEIEDQKDNEDEEDLRYFSIKKVYGCKVVVSNCTAVSQTFQLLMEIPNGSIPVDTTFSTKTLTYTVAPYQSFIQKYFFYFPKTGNFTIYPANISKLGKVIQIAKEKIFEVYDERAKVNLENINELLTTDNNQDILNYIENKNIFNEKWFNPKLLYHKFSDETFYNQVMQIYRKRKFYDYHSFAYALLHNNVQCLKELFMTQKAQKALKQYFNHFACSLFEINSIRILEYYPLIIKRVHKLQNGENNILNVQLRKQYTNYLIYLLEKPQFSTIDKLILIYYLLLQERVNEAVQVYSQISEEEQKEQQLQFDYLSAYLDFYTGYPNFQKGRDICKKYLSYPVIHWRNMFYEMINLLIEYDGEEDNQFSKLEITQQQRQQEIAKKEETLSGSIEGDSISITYSNLSEVKIEYYKLDIEILFSNNPFMKNIIQDFSIVLPNVCTTHTLEGQEIQKNLYQQKIQIPREIVKENLFVTIKGLQKQVTCKYQPTSLFVQTMADSGQIRVFNQQGQYLCKVYVKVYSRDKNDKETFYKDGYTDLRGRFDYSSLSSANFKDIDKFSMLVYHEELGSIIQQVSPPPTLGQYEKEIKLIGNKWRQQERDEYQNKERVQQTMFIGKGGKGMGIGKVSKRRDRDQDQD
ncbi:unnamed protein product (macronuclear) [Paramecium tetraurelia]|uniref:Uncharacterized protein n=1 Tax=Paramecium tetraurelia TaxID=5888 RepID=A0DL58_PARTE|nr:uncharacterized protein GSPATT00018092001 [Paramecium tetraurelia]CAK83775.1 unnamed protein product [Paramecium tetraurelia]|eukprot:XP_001451172.1 hypothetical protein (macronuclear) [Paramecium tetraurelia strain d4-2]